MSKEKSIQTVLEFPDASTNIMSALKLHDLALLRSLGICFPACVYSYDSSTHSVEVMPLVKQGLFAGKWVYLNRNIRIKTTVRNIQCGGITITHPIYIGDTGWVFASDRDTTLLKQMGALTNSVLGADRPIAMVENDYQQQPASLDIHTFSSGFFLPDNWGAWETWRFKDDYGVPLDGSFYMGSSIDTRDEIEEVEGRQEGDLYEKKNSASIVLQQRGVYILSSTPIQPDDAPRRDRHAKVAVSGDTVQLAVSNLFKDTPMSALVSLSVDSGLVIRHDDTKHKRHFIMSVQENQFTMRLTDASKEKSVSMTFKDGNLDVSTSDNINIYAKKKVNVKSGESAYVSAKEVRVVATGDASVTARDVSASATKNVNIAAGGMINLTAPKYVNLVTAELINIYAKERGAQIRVVTMSQESSIEIRAEGKKSNITILSMKEESNISLQVQGESSYIDISTTGDKSPIQISVAGDESPIEVTSLGESSQIDIRSEGSKSPITLSTIGSESQIALNSQGEHSSIDITSEGKESQIALNSQGEQASIDIKSEGSNSPISILTEENESQIIVNSHGKSSHIEILAEGDESDIDLRAAREANIYAAKTVNVIGSESINISSNKTVNIEGGDMVSVSASDITLTGRVSILGSLHLNGNPFTPYIHYDNIQYWSWA